jgi:hypothetical protein
MKLLIWFIISIISFTKISAQKKYFDFGLTGGASYYWGDINPDKQFYRPSPAFGVFGRYNINNRQAFRLSVSYLQIQGKDSDSDNLYQQLRNASFSASFIEVAPTYEFHFLPYIIDKKARGFSPYIYGGIAYIFYLSSESTNGSKLTVPFGAGIKYSLSKKVGVGVEWGLRKTFNDYMDGVLNPGEEETKPVLINNDWYSYAGFFISFRLNDNSGDCPVYQ